MAYNFSLFSFFLSGCCCYLTQSGRDNTSLLFEGAGKGNRWGLSREGCWFLAVSQSSVWKSRAKQQRLTLTRILLPPSEADPRRNRLRSERQIKDPAPHRHVWVIFCWSSVPRSRNLPETHLNESTRSSSRVVQFVDFFLCHKFYKKTHAHIKTG